MAAIYDVDTYNYVCIYKDNSLEQIHIVSSLQTIKGELHLNKVFLKNRLFEIIHKFNY